MLIRDIPLGFKKNETIHCSLNGRNSKYPFYKGIKLHENTNTKVIIHCTEAEKKLVSESIIREFAGDSKLVYEIEKTTNVRSAAITDIKSNKDKFLEYLRVNNIECRDGYLEKLKHIEDSLDINLNSGTHSYTLLKMSLRGAIGIREGIHKEEVEIDFTKYADGLIAITGDNGKGKTTCIENCHPYPRLLTRRGKLQDHFYLKDSFRKLLYLDNDGTYYLIEMFIDGKSSSGKVKYVVSSGTDVDNLEPVTDIDGNSDNYDEWVEKMFGPVELFLRTCFFAKEAVKGIPDISETTKGEKKDLFISLIGIDNLNEISEAAKTFSNALSRDIEALESRFEDIDYDIIRKNITESLKKDSELLENLKLHRKELRNVIKEAETKKTEWESSVPDTDTLERMRSMYREQKSQKEFILDYEKNIKKYESLKSMFDRIQVLKDKSLELKGECMSRELKVSKAESKLSELKSEAGTAATKLKMFRETKLLALDNFLCPTCGKPLPVHRKQELRAEIKENNKELKRLEREAEKTAKAAEEFAPEIEKLSHSYEVAKRYLDDNDRVLRNKTAEVEGFNIKAIEKKEAEYTFTKSQFNEEKHKKLWDDITKLTQAIKERTQTAEKEIKKLKDVLSKSESQLTSVEFDIDKLNLEIGSYQAKLAILATDEEKQISIRKEHKEKVEAMEEYDVLVKAFSKNGIQALELEALAPEIAGITNSILSSAYGDRFKVSFETLRTGSSGQLIEDFSILVEDTSTGTSRPLEWLSSGEAVWIKEALYNAFTIERQRTTGFTFKTRFLDESDGSLDSAARLKYLNMIESAHKEGGVNHTIIITHSQELKDLIAQQINIANL